MVDEPVKVAVCSAPNCNKYVDHIGEYCSELCASLAPKPKELLLYRIETKDETFYVAVKDGLSVLDWCKKKWGAANLSDLGFELRMIGGGPGQPSVITYGVR